MKFTEHELTAIFDGIDLDDIAYFQGTSFYCKYLNPYRAAQLLGIEISTASPMVRCKTSDVPGISTGIMITVGELASVGDNAFQDSPDNMFVDTVDNQFDKSGQTIYYVIDVQHDGTGITNLILSRDRP